MKGEFSIHLSAFMLRVKDNCETAIFIQTICVSLARVNNHRIEILRPVHQIVYYNDKLNIFYAFFTPLLKNHPERRMISKVSNCYKTDMENCGRAE